MTDRLERAGHALHWLVLKVPADCRGGGDVCIVHDQPWAHNDSRGLHCVWREAALAAAEEWTAALEARRRGLA